MCSTCPIRYRANYIDDSKQTFLPYHREINSYLPSPVARSNYTSYHIFCLKKNITPLIREININYDISFQSKKHFDSMVLSWQLYDGGYPIEPDNATHDLITSNQQKYVDLYPYCLLYRIGTAKKRYNPIWCEDILPHIVKNIGIYNNGDVFVNLENFPDHNTRWQKMYEYIENALTNYYNEGIVYDPPGDLIRKWKLERVEEKLYKTNWKHKFTHSKIEFLYSDDKRIIIYLGDNNKVKVVEGWFIQRVKDYTQVEEILDYLM